MDRHNSVGSSMHTLSLLESKSRLIT